MQFQDWGIIKPTWKAEFSDPFVRDPYHVIMCGRSGYEYENEINPDTKQREIYKSGVKMKVEGETAYEPDMLVLMERFEEVLGEDKKVWREATILKDRSTLIDGKTFKNPTYESFTPSIEAMMADSSTAPPVPEGNAGLLFDLSWTKATRTLSKKLKVCSRMRKTTNFTTSAIRATRPQKGYYAQYYWRW